MNMINNYSILESYKSANLIFEDDSDTARVAHDIDTPDKPESNYAPVTFISIAKDIENISKSLLSDTAQALSRMFINGPSKSVISKGKFTVEPVAEFPTEDTDSNSGNDKSSDKSDSSSNGSSSDNTTNSGPFKNQTRIPNNRQPRQASVRRVNSSLVRNSYSILNAYNTIHQINEEDNSTAESDEFSVGSFLRVRAELAKEGYTDWYIALDKDVASNDMSQNAVISLLKSGKFKEAYNKANSEVSTNHVGLVPVAVQSFLYESPDCGIPWMGHCRYAIGAGSEENNTAFHDIITLSVVPENINTDKNPSKDMLFLARFQIKDVSVVSGNLLGFISNVVGSTVDWLIDGKGIADRIRTDKSNDPSKVINDFLTEDKFRGKTPGDSSMYDSFLKIRNWVKENVNKKAFIYLDKSIDGRPVSDTVKEYSQQHSKESKSPIYF